MKLATQAYSRAYTANVPDTACSLSTEVGDLSAVLIRTCNPTPNPAGKINTKHPVSSSRNPKAVADSHTLSQDFFNLRVFIKE